jgi:alpha-L-rhamnosidase
MKTNHPLNRNFWNPALLLPGLWLLFSFVGEKIPAIPENLTVNLRKTPVGIESNPCFSWESGVVRQNACQIVVALSPEDLQDQKYVWNSGKVISGKDFQIPYKGPVLQSATRYYWQVRVWNEKNIMAESKPSWWETGLLKPEDWEPAQWIGGRDPQDHNWKDMTATVRFRITEARAGISFLFHAEPVGKTWGEAYVWKLAASKEAGKVELSMKTSHFAGNTGVPRPGPGDPAVDWGVNYFDPQGVINPLKTGTRIVDLATRTAENAGGLSHDNLLTADHELKVRVTGDEVTTWIDGVLADQRTLSGDQLREQGSIGFESGSNAVIRSVRVESSKIDGGNGTANDFYTDFAGGYNPFEDGMVRWTGIKGDSSTEGLVLMPGRGIMLPVSNPAPLLRKEFSVAGSPVVAARLFIAGGGYPRVMVNGIPVTTDGALPDENGFNITHLTPGDGQSETFILSNTFDVTRFINSGKTNALAVELGRGWTGLTIPSEWFWNLIPTHADPRTRIKLIITHLDGKQEEIVSDENWKTTDGPVLFNSVASGEKYDAGKAKSLDGWKMAGFDDRSWNPVTRVNPMGSYYGTGKYHALVPTTGLLPEGFVESRLQAMENEPIVVRETLKPVAILETWPGSGVFLFKFAQMHSGWPMLHLKGLRPEQAGLTLRIRGDNIIKGNGTKEEPYALSDNSRFHAGTIQTDYYILSDDAEQVWSPAFHYNGQGAVEVHGLRNVLGRAPDMEHDSDLITAEVASSGLQMNSVNTDNPLLNRIFSLCQWTMLNNAHGHPTDTPSREKNGWTGDGWADAEAWMNNFDMSQFYRLWVRDMAAGMNPDGDLNVVMPGPRAYGFDNTPGWSMANGAVPAWDLAFFEVPFDLYRYYGDEAILKEVFPMQEKFMDYYTKRFTKESPDTFKNPFQ